MPTLDFVSCGENLPEGGDTEATVAHVLGRLEADLVSCGKTWSHAGLLILADSVAPKSQDAQQEIDRALLRALHDFSAERGWFPALVGASVFASFYSGPSGSEPDITNGFHFTAVCSSTQQRFPVAVEAGTTPQGRRMAGYNVVSSVIGEGHLQYPATVLLFTSGSGHVKAESDIDFNECFALGQELLNAWPDGLNIIGGCSSHRTPNYVQCLYYSDCSPDGTVEYHSTYQHAAVCSVLPHEEAMYLQYHPFRRFSEKPLKIKWHEKDKYDDGRYYYVELINDEPPIEYLARHWQVPKHRLLTMQQEHTPIPYEAQTFLYTIASSRRAEDRAIWPNVPVWFEKIDDKVMLRLVRAEEHNSNFYMMAMGERDTSGSLRRASEASLLENCLDLTLAARDFSANQRQSTVLSFLCESRKILLQEADENIEAGYFIERLAPAAGMVGIYLNGEYSVGSPASIGYHNFSLLGAVIPLGSPEPFEATAVIADAADAASERAIAHRVLTSAALTDAENLAEHEAGAQTAGGGSGPTRPSLPISERNSMPSRTPDGMLPASATNDAGGDVRPSDGLQRTPLPGPLVSPGPAPVPAPNSTPGSLAAQIPGGGPAPGPTPVPRSGPIMAEGTEIEDDAYDEEEIQRQIARDYELAALARLRANELHAAKIARNGASGPDTSARSRGPLQKVVRRVVTGVDGYGSAAIVSDEQVPPRTSVGLPGTEIVYLWGADAVPAVPTTGQPSGYAGHFPRLGGFRCVMLTLEPQRRVDTTPAPREARAHAEEAFPGLLETFDPQVEGMHASTTVDLVVVVSGTVTLDVDQQNRTILGPGDVIVQNGVRHRWINQGDVEARLMFVLIGARVDNTDRR